MDVILIGVYFDEFVAASYKGVSVEVGQEPVKTFFTGLPKDDCKAAREYAATYGLPIMNRSSVDHFVMDGGVLWD